MTEIAFDYLGTFYDAIEERAEKSSFFTGLLQGLEDNTGIQKPYIVTGVTIFFLLFMVLVYGPLILVDVLGLLYPAYLSFQALRSHDKEEIAYCLKHWLNSVFSRILIQFLDSIFLGFPGYNILKALYYFWCYFPVANNGSILIYENYIKPTFIYKTEAAETVLEKVKSFTSSTKVNK